MKKIENVNILVVGDIMLDEYIIGDVTRISPEAPVPIVNVTDMYYKLGGCGNVISNLASLGAKVTCVASVGHDRAGELILKELRNYNVNTRYLLSNNKFTTTLKSRVISNDRQVQMLRFDIEKIQNIDTSKIELKNVYDIIIVSDYAKGMITESLMKKLKNLSNIIIVDPKPINSNLYNKVFLITPNQKEYNEMLILNNCNFPKSEYILKTMGKNGMELIQNPPREKSNIHIKSKPVDVYNVSGAGDTVVAIISLCLSMGYDMFKAAKIANKCAGYVVTQPGTSTVPRKFLEKLL